MGILAYLGPCGSHWAYIQTLSADFGTKSRATFAADFGTVLGVPKSRRPGQSAFGRSQTSVDRNQGTSGKHWTIPTESGVVSAHPWGVLNMLGQFGQIWGGLDRIELKRARHANQAFVWRPRCMRFRNQRMFCAIILGGFLRSAPTGGGLKARDQKRSSSRVPGRMRETALSIIGSGLCEIAANGAALDMGLDFGMPFEYNERVCSSSHAPLHSHVVHQRAGPLNSRPSPPYTPVDRRDADLLRSAASLSMYHDERLLCLTDSLPDAPGCPRMPMVDPRPTTRALDQTPRGSSTCSSCACVGASEDSAEAASPNGPLAVFG